MASNRDLLSQFRGLTLENVGAWPMAPRGALWLFVLLACASGGWFALWSGQRDQLEQLQSEETKLKDEYKSKLQQAISLDELRKQREQVSQYVLTLEKQLPSKSDVDRAIDAATKAWTAWRKTPGPERGRVIWRAADIARRRAWTRSHGP